MSLNTNGWDYTYNVNIEKLNALISNEKNSFSTLIVNTIENTATARILSCGSVNQKIKRH